MATRTKTKAGWGLSPLFIIPWLLYGATIVWYPVHESVLARERVANADLSKCREHAASVQALKFCEGDYARDMEDARVIHWDRHPLWHPLWFAPLVLFLPLFGIYGLIWIMTRGSA